MMSKPFLVKYSKWNWKKINVFLLWHQDWIKKYKTFEKIKYSSLTESKGSGFEKKTVCFYDIDMIVCLSKYQKSFLLEHQENDFRERSLQYTMVLWLQFWFLHIIWQRISRLFWFLTRKEFLNYASWNSSIKQMIYSLKDLHRVRK